MNELWNWTDFFHQDIQPPFVIKAAMADCFLDLLKLPFKQGLAVIVTSVPTFAHDQWATWYQLLKEYAGQHTYIDYWLLIGDLMRHYLEEVRMMLSYEVEQAISLLQRSLKQLANAEQFALMTSLYHYAQSSLQAHMIFQYLLQNCDPQAQQMQNLLHFYKSLTERQKDVAILTAQGLTNREIADILYIEPIVVAEHLTNIFNKFHNLTGEYPEKQGTRYRLIHWLTRLFIEQPHLLFDRKF